jgi:hypothetical protein
MTEENNQPMPGDIIETPPPAPVDPDITGLDEMYGEGALEELVVALTISGEESPIVTEGVIDADVNKWPVEGGIWVKTNATWKDGTNLAIYFQNDLVYWGDGICFTEDVLSSVGKLTGGTLWEYALDKKITMTKMIVPDNFAAPFIATAFNFVSSDGTTTILESPIYEGSKMDDYTVWARNGFKPEEMPDSLKNQQ